MELKIKELKQSVETELLDLKRIKAKQNLAVKLRELSAAKRVVARLEKQLKEFEEGYIEDIELTSENSLMILTGCCPQGLLPAGDWQVR